MIVDFYHLAVSPLEKVLPRICERLLADGEQVLIVAAPGQIDTLDELLWGYARDAFLPHARAGSDGDARHPILLADTLDATVAGRNVAIADGQWRDAALTADRVFYMFDPGAVDQARVAWSGLKGREEIERRYWKQDAQGKWVQGP